MQQDSVLLLIHSYPVKIHLLQFGGTHLTRDKNSACLVFNAVNVPA